MDFDTDSSSLWDDAHRETVLFAGVLFLHSSNGSMVEKWEIENSGGFNEKFCGYQGLGRGRYERKHRGL